MTILNREKILELAKSFIDEGRLDKAIREYEKILLADPKDMRIKLRVAELYTKRKQINDAIRIYREVADSYKSEGFLLKAVTVYKNMLRLNPSLIEVNEELAALYEKMGLLADAVRQYDIIASALDLRGVPERVIEVRKKIVSISPEDGSARVKLAEAFQREGRTEEAIDQYEDYALRLEKQGVDRRRLGDVYEKILAHRPKNYDLMRKLIAIYEELGEHKKALKWLEDGREIVESDPQLLSLMAGIYASQNQQETARGKYLMLADLQREAGNVEAALDACFEILVMMPDEEDRLYKRVEEMSPGAMAGLVERANARRMEIEAEELRRQEEETDKAHADEQDERGPGFGEADAARPRPEAKGKTAPQPKVQPEPEPAVAPKPKAPPEPEPKPGPEPEPSAAPGGGLPARPDAGRAHADYNLGTAYMKTGLTKEARALLKRALEAYSALAAAGEADEGMKLRISQIEAALGQSEERGEGRAEPPAAAAKGAEVKGEAGKRGGREPPQASEEKKTLKGSKKRVSYV